ncbi:MAG: tail fiber domain-containing protein, partial [Bacteroidota bacterium]
MKKNLFVISAACLLQVSFVYSQTNHNNNVSGSTVSLAEPLGWLSGSSNDLDIINNLSSKNINLSTFNGSLIKRMTILSTGEVGIGNFTPAFLFDVNGDIDINTTTGAYWLANGSGSDRILWHNADLTSIFVGVNAGNSGINAAGGLYNTLVGNNAGVATTGGLYNTAIGFEALYKNNDAHQNVAIGCRALHEIATGIIDDGSPASENTAVGVNALYNNLAYGGCALGFKAGEGNQYGCSLIAIGEEAAQLSLDGNNNMAIGEASLKHNAYLSENVALGKTAMEMMNYVPSFTCLSPAHGCLSSYNVAVGNAALRNTNPSSDDGSSYLLNGMQNTALGHAAGETNFHGYNNSFLGYLADVYSSTPNIYNATAIGANAQVRFNNNMILGDNNVNVGIGLSGNSIGPKWKLETDAGTSGRSGLGFRQLLPGSPNGVSSYGQVLTVAITGEVVLTDDAGFNTIGYQLCPNPFNLPGHVGMKLKNYNIYHDGQGLDFTNSGMLNAIGLGYNCGVVLPGKLSVDETYISTNVTFGTKAGYFHNGDVGTNLVVGLDKTGIYVRTDGVTTGGPGVTLKNLGGDFLSDNCGTTDIAVRGFAGANSGHNLPQVAVGAEFEADNGTKSNTGVIATANSNTTGQTSWGVYAKGVNATINNIGVSAISSGGGTGVNYGIYASAPIGPCLPGGCANAAGNFNGDVWGINAYIISDISLKENIQPLQNGIDVINALNPKTYTFKTSQHPQINLPSGTQDGLIAQELETILPELVKSFNVAPRRDSLGDIDTTGTGESYRSVNYIAIIPYLIQGMKEQQQMIEAMQAQLDNCCNAGNRHSDPGGDEGNSNGIDVELKNIRQIVLNQNFPNPFAEHTLITFIIPSDVKEAQMFFYD